MAGTLLHITLAHEALERCPIDTASTGEIKRQIHEFRLGSILPDLPYYDRMWLTGLRAIAGLEIQYADWGAAMHLHSPTALALALLETATCASERALALGFLTHIAVDVIFHAEIERRVRAEENSQVGPEQSHKNIEDQMDLHVHDAYLGHPGVGTPYPRRVLSIRPECSWAEYVVAALIKGHGTFHSPGRLRKCLDALGMFGIIYSVRGAPWIKVREHNPELRETALRLARESIALSATYLEAGVAFLKNDISKAEFERVVPPRSLSDGSPL